MIVRPDRRQYQVLDILIEFKFVSLKEAGLDGKTLVTIDREVFRSLPAVQKTMRTRSGSGPLSGPVEEQIRRSAAPAQLQCGGNRIQSAGVCTVGVIHVIL